MRIKHQLNFRKTLSLLPLSTIYHMLVENAIVLFNSFFAKNLQKETIAKVVNSCKVQQ